MQKLKLVDTTMTPDSILKILAKLLSIDLVRVMINSFLDDTVVNTGLCVCDHFCNTDQSVIQSKPSVSV